MSLFESTEYQWRETFFVLFDASNRPRVREIRAEFDQLGDRFKVVDLRPKVGNEPFESMTVLAPNDFAAMDILCVTGDEVIEQMPDLVNELRKNLDSAVEASQLALISASTGRLDVLHFEQQSLAFGSDADDEEFIDPGGLLTVLGRLGEICQGIVVDPQSASLL